MARILITTQPHEGHLNPTFSISHQLVQQGHEVIYLDHPLIKKLIAQQGFPSVPFRFLRPGDIGLLWHKYQAHDLGRATTLKLVDQQKIPPDVAFAVVGPLAFQGMIQPFWS